MIKAPYDARNQRDYCEMTEKIELALDELRRNASIPATENSLAQLAGCSRNTLRNRRHPIKELKRIKTLRSVREVRNSTHIAQIHRFSRDVNTEESKTLVLQLSRSREETAVWVNKFFLLQAEFDKVERLNELLHRGNELLESQIKDLRSSDCKCIKALVN